MPAAQADEKATTSSPPHDPESALNPASTDKDIAINLVGEHAQEIDPEIEARVLRKIDWFLIPAMIVGMSMSPALSSPALSSPALSSPTLSIPSISTPNISQNIRLTTNLRLRPSILR
jgi:hypothetical protein